ncbi:Sas10/Utp3/C1D family-domain-containing protein [Radiomyces spectabilis]|uniref:Sas10/Utp3/C1D family-domain-containing protein n=1 Tax=Radiomyces spectabilis TaxID=64574 RepID=UPI00221EFC74|nr:Sas10/Utp3/C1D family-domain-containing protein [Radiomyces spectabilis]KAI8391780.1 Sas10/Utp3/C1D family-domain-containing protein [Radiomyces spectabilis]
MSTAAGSTADNVTQASEKSEFKKLIQELKAKVIELKGQLKPLKQKLEDGELQTSKGVSFLEVKYHLMIQYVLQLAFYVNLKLSGKQLAQHPVVDSLVELRVILDKMKPIEAKLKYQVDKLVRAAVMGTQQAADKPTDSVSSTTAMANDPLAFKPNLENLMNKDDEEEGGEMEEDNTGVYRPPKLAPVTYDEARDSKKNKQERDQQRLREKASRSRLMKDVMAEMNETPEEIDALGGVNEGLGYGDRVDSMIAEKDRYEEDNYVRLAVTRKEKQRLKAKNRMRFESEFDNLNDFSNLVDIQSIEEQENERFRNVLNRKHQRGQRDEDDEVSVQMCNFFLKSIGCTEVSSSRILIGRPTFKASTRRQR